MSFVEYADFAAVAGNSGSSATMTVTKPSGAVAGDIVVAFLFTGSSSSAILLAASGWMLLESDPGGAGSDMSGWAYYKILGAGEPASWDWTLVVSATWHTVAVSATTPNATSPIADSNVAEENAVDNSLAITSAALDVDNALVIVCGVVDATGAARTWTTSGGESERYDAMLQALHVGVYTDGSVKAVGATKTSGPLVVTGSNQYMIVFQVCIRGNWHLASGVRFGLNVNQRAWMDIIYDPGTNVAKYLEFGNEHPAAIALEYSVTDGTTTWTGSVTDAPIGSEADRDISAGAVTVDFNAATDEYDFVNLGVTYLRLNL